MLRVPGRALSRQPGLAFWRSLFPFSWLRAFAVARAAFRSRHVHRYGAIGCCPDGRAEPKRGAAMLRWDCCGTPIRRRHGCRACERPACPAGASDAGLGRHPHCSGYAVGELGVRICLKSELGPGAPRRMLTGPEGALRALFRLADWTARIIKPLRTDCSKRRITKKPEKVKKSSNSPFGLG